MVIDSGWFSTLYAFLAVDYNIKYIVPYVVISMHIFFFFFIK